MNEEEKLKRVVMLAREKGDTDLEMKALLRIKELRASPQQEQIQAVGLGPAKEMLKGAVAPIAAGYAAIAGSVLPGEQGQGSQWASETRKYIQGIGGQPTEQTQQELATIGNLPVIKQIGQAQEYYQKEKVEKPAAEFETPLASAAYQTITGTAPALLEMAFGLKTGKVAKKGSEQLLSQAQKAQESIIKNLKNEPEFKVYTDDSASMFTPESIEVVKGLYDKKMAEKPEVMKEVSKMESAGANPLEIDAYVQKMLGMPDLLTPRQMEMYNTFGRTGVTPLRADITQSADDQRMTRDAEKYSGKVADVRSQQESQLLSAAERAKEMTGGTAIEGRGTGETGAKIFNVMDGVVQQYDDAVGNAYTAAKELSPVGKNIKPSGLAAVTRANMWKDKTAGAGGVPSAMRNLMRELGVMDKGFNVQGKIDANTAERLRQELNAMYKSAPPDGRMIIKEMKDALDEDVISVVGEDVFKEARQAKISYHKLIEKEKGKRDATRGSFVEDIVYGKISPEQIPTKLKTANYSDKVKLKKFLTEDAGDAGKEAWNDMRAQVVQDAIEKAMSSSGKAEGGVKKFQGKKFRDTVYNSLSTSDSRQIDLFFNKDERQMIDDIASVFEARIPQQLVQSGSGPSAFSVEQMLNRMGTTGEIAKGVYIPAKGAQKLYGYLLNRANIKQQISPAKATEKEIKRELR